MRYKTTSNLPSFFPASERRNMELIIYAPKEDGFIQAIDWNFEDLKAEITEKAKDYMTLVYSDDQIKEAKKDRANLNKFKKALEDKRKDVKKQVMEPYADFEKKIKELTGIVDEAVNNIDRQVRDFEEIQRDEKRIRCREIYTEVIGDMDRIIPFEKAFNEKWLNKTVSEGKIKLEIAFLRDRVDAELKALNAETSPYIFEMKEAYLKDFDINAAYAVRREREETEKKKALFEAEEKRREEERIKALEAKARQIHQAGQEPAPEPMKKPERVICVTFRVTAKESQFDALNQAIAMLKANSEKTEIIERKEL